MVEQAVLAEQQARNAEEANAEHAGGPDYSATPQPVRPPPQMAEAFVAPPVVEISPTQLHVNRVKRKVESPSQLPAIDEDVVPPKTAAMKSDGPLRQTRSGSSVLQPGFLDAPSGRSTGLNGPRARGYQRSQSRQILRACFPTLARICLVVLAKRRTP
jgi:hypothetical protein